MTTTLAARRVALAGNPNTGKTTLFNRLTGGHGKVGNYPGVTVERQTGEMRLSGGLYATLTDVPGTYSLSARSAEEQIAIQAIAGLHPLERPDAVLLVLDSTQLTRNLYLALQVIELDLPLVIAVNMVDMLGERGLSLDSAALERELGVPTVPICASSGRNVDALRAALARVLEEPRRGRPGPRWIPATQALMEDVRAVGEAVPASWHHGEPQRQDALALWALLSLDEQDEIEDAPAELRSIVLARRHAASGAGREIEAEVIHGRYAWIDGRAPLFLRQDPAPRASRTDRVDRVLLHPLAGFALFLCAMGVVFQSLFSWADPAIALVERLFGALEAWVLDVMPPGIASDFVANGLIEGVGSVLVFLPQILLLFFFIVLMEDTGYMARVAFLMDRLMKSIGLHGRAFVPMMSGFACAVPAILATRTMERRRDRMLTMMVIPLMTCSARLPVYALLIGALFPPDRIFGLLPVQGLMMVGMYVFSTVVALVAAAVLGRTLFKGPRVPLLLEMPPYRMPHWPSVLRSVWRRSQLFLSEAGTVILACTIVIWALLSFPRDRAVEQRYGELRTAAIHQESGADLERRLAEIEGAREGEALRASYGGRIGRSIEPAIAPLGFDWKIGIGLVGAFVAREVFVSTMGVVYGMGEAVDEEATGLRQRLRQEAHADGRPVYTPLVGFSLMVFFALACQCMSTLAVVRRETRTWRWPLFLFLYTGALAWLASFAVYQGGRLLGLAS
jgi:ferrous iron transport protein B